MDNIDSSPNSSIEISESNSYGFNQLNQRYKSLRESLELNLNVYNTPLIQKQLRDYHEGLWTTLNLYKKSFLPIKSESLTQLEDIIINLFVFGDDVIGPTLDFKSLDYLKEKPYLIKPVQQIVIRFLDTIERFLININSPGSLTSGETTKLLAAGEVPITLYRWVGKPERIKTLNES